MRFRELYFSDIGKFVEINRALSLRVQHKTELNFSKTLPQNSRYFMKVLPDIRDDKALHLSN